MKATAASAPWDITARAARSVRTEINAQGVKCGGNKNERLIGRFEVSFCFAVCNNDGCLCQCCSP